jgi:hypothetical protein
MIPYIAPAGSSRPIAPPRRSATDRQRGTNLAAGPATAATARLIFNNRLDAAVTATLLVMVAVVLVESLRHWIHILTGREEARLKEAPFVMTRLAEERI